MVHGTGRKRFTDLSFLGLEGIVMAHSLLSKYWEVRSDRISRGIGVEDMSDDPDVDDVMTWALNHIEAQHRVIVKDTQKIISLRTAIEEKSIF